tara:strand:+ start:1951 stop:2163 length:213 start_codon:yes stop_codon:yes gene_type:complete
MKQSKKSDTKKAAKKETPKKAVPKKETPKKEIPKTLGELKKEFAAARKANPEKDAELRAQYLKDKKKLQS